MPKQRLPQLLLLLLLLLLPKTAPTAHHSRRKIAVFWVFTGEPSFYWKWSLATLLNAGADRVHVHLILGVPPPRLESLQRELLNYPLSDRVIFHSVLPRDWAARAQLRLNLSLPFDLDGLGRKVADFKPTLGLLFADFIPPSVYSHWVYGDSDGFFGRFVWAALLKAL